MMGRRIGSWILERELGRGGMGAVFAARHATLSTRAAVKVLSAGLESEESFRNRFQREAELQSQLRHPNVARVLDYLEDQGQWFLIVDYLERGSLADLLARGERVPRAQAIDWARQALAGLGHAHQKGIVHRDVKPANLLLGDNNEIVVADFGIARLQGSAGLTTTGVAVGTPHYMSPEQIVTPDKVNHRTDIYSLGIVVYELLAGRKPFDSPSQFAILQAHVSEPPPSLRSIDPSIPPHLDAAVMRALAKRPDDRYPDCAAVSAALAGTAPPAVASGATVHASALLERLPVAMPAALSPGELRNKKRRSYQRRLAAAAVTTAAIATLFASMVANRGSDAAPPPIIPGTVSSATTTSGTDVSHQPNPDDPHKVHHEGSSQPVPTDSREQATVAPAPRGAPLPERPRVAVIGAGDDPLFAGALEQEMEHRLDGFDVADEQGEPEVGELLRKRGANAGVNELGAVLMKSGFHVLVLLRVQTAASRTTSIHGIEGSIKAARIHLNAYLLPAHRSIGGGWTEPVEYTEGSAAAIARKAFIGPTADLRSAIDAEWSRLRAGGAGGMP